MEYMGIGRGIKTVCIYHGNCFDGMAAAWVVSLVFPDATFIPGHYGDNKLITNLTQDCYENANINTRYILVDFSLPRELMVLMNNKAVSLLVLDHHKTAQADCEGLPFCVFDMNESGASLAWKYFFQGGGPIYQRMPLLVQYIKDRDLWLFKEINSSAVNAFIQSYEMSIESYAQINLRLEGDLSACTFAGEVIERYKTVTVQRIVEARRLQIVAGYQVPVVNSIVLMSEVGEALAKLNEGPFAAYYFDRSDGIRQWGARSIGDFDVSTIAKQFGGGGHKNAAGWQESVPGQHTPIA
jgi:oligoribonuclease NrnB/cAMP/cGMP phosphodiesterase (DHH superfamily)